MSPTRITTTVAGCLVTLVLAGCGPEETDPHPVPKPDEAAAETRTLEGAPIEQDLDPFIVAFDEVTIQEIVTPPEPSPPTADAEPEPEVCRTFNLAGPTFTSNSAALQPAAESGLQALAVELVGSGCGDTQARCDGQLQLTVTGHTDSIPTSRQGGNLQLSQDRADVVAQMLTDNGLVVVASVGVGDSEPAVADPDQYRTLEEEHAADRRTVINVTCAPSSNE